MELVIGPYVHQKVEFMDLDLRQVNESLRGT
jgi:hypothetical protein